MNTLGLGFGIENIVNPATNEPVKISEVTRDALARSTNVHAFTEGYQMCLVDQWVGRQAVPRHYSVRLRGVQLVETFPAVSHRHNGGWVAFYDATGEAQVTINEADIISISFEADQA